jgi:radial spoke head protein 9
LQTGISELLNEQTEVDFEELLFWGRIDGMEADYYICMGVTYTDKYEFPEKRFFWASSNAFCFKPFATLNDQHKKEVETYMGSAFTGNPALIHIKVEPEISPEDLEA